MRRLQKGKRGRKPGKKTEPLAEGIIPLDSRGMRSWKLMTDEKIVAYALRIVKENDVCSRSELQRMDHGLYNTLRKRKLFDMVGLQELRREWGAISDVEILEYAGSVIDDKGVGSRKGLKEADPGLYEILRKRKLLDDAIRAARPMKRERRKWNSMSDDELVDYAKRAMRVGGLTRRNELDGSDPGLYEVLRKRRLIGAAGFEETRRDWASMSDDELVGHGQAFVAGKKLRGRSGLAAADHGLYGVLRKRRLLGRVVPESTHSNRKKARNWISMSDDKLIRYARGVVKEKGLENRTALMEADSGLHSVLRRRKLLVAVFAPIESQKKREAVQQVVEAMEEFEGQDL